MALAVSGRIFPKFLLLQDTANACCHTLCALGDRIARGAGSVAGGAVRATSLRAVAALAQTRRRNPVRGCPQAVRAPVRASGMPHVTYPTRRWIRLAFAMMLAGATADFGLALAESLGRRRPRSPSCPRRGTPWRKAFCCR